MKKAALECWFMNVNVMNEPSNYLLQSQFWQCVAVCCCSSGHRMLVKNQSGQHTDEHIYRHVQHTHTHTHTHTAAMGFLGAQYKKCTEGSHIQLERLLHTKGKQWTHTLTHTLTHTHTHTLSLRHINEKPYLGKTTAAVILKANIFFTQHRIEFFFLRWIYGCHLCLDVKKTKVPERLCQFY